MAWPLEALFVGLSAVPLLCLALGVLLVAHLLLHGAGRLVLRGGAERDLSERLLLAPPFGLAVVGLVSFALAALGLFSSSRLVLMTVLLQALSVRHWRSDFGDLKDYLVKARAGSGGLWKSRIKKALGNGRSNVLLVGPLLASAALLLLALYPRLDIDETMYHLPLAQAVEDSGSLPFVSHLRYPVFPILQELTWAPMISALGQSGPGLLVAWQTIWVALLLAFWVAPAEPSGVSPRLWSFRPICAASLWLGNTLLCWIGTGAMVDVSLAMFALLAAICVDQWERTRGWNWIFAAGVASGAVFATKYHGLVIFALLVIGLGVARWTRSRFKALGAFVLVTVLVAAPMYTWITVKTGNPLFPYLPEVFGYSEWSQQDAAALMPSTTSVSNAGPRSVAKTLRTELGGRVVRGFTRDLDDIPRFVKQLTIAPPNSDDPAPLSVWLLLLAPVAFWAPAGRRRLELGEPTMKSRCRAWRWALLSIFFLAAWFATARDARYLLAVIPWIATVYAYGLEALVSKWRDSSTLRSLVVTIVPLALVMPTLLEAGHRLAEYGAVPLSGEARESFLHRNRAGYTALRNAEAHWIANGDADQDPRIFTLFGSPLQYFARWPLYGDWYGPQAYSRYGDFQSEDVVGKLSAEGFRYLLEVHPGAPATTPQHRGLKLLYWDSDSLLFEVSP